MKVLNKRTDNIPSDAIYVGRPTKWGNPFIIGKDGNRDDVVKLYAEYIMKKPELLSVIIDELDGHDLVCWCSPQLCHADVLIEIINLIKS